MSLKRIATSLLFILLVSPSFAQAQQLDTTNADLRFFETPYGFNTRNAGNEIAPFERSDSRNRTSINGNSGLGTQSVSALGNAISVEIDGSGNTVIITAEQINNGDQNAALILNGELALE